MAENGGFEPPVGFPTYAFQAYTFSHSVNSPALKRPICHWDKYMTSRSEFLELSLSVLPSA